MAKFGFDTSEVDVNAQPSYDPLPPGDYTLHALEAEEKDTRSGSMIACKFEVSTGEYAGRFVWFNFNINNSSAKAQEIGRRQLVSWATAAGKPDAKDTDVLIGRKFNATLGIEKGSGGYADKSTIKMFLIGGDAPAGKTPAPAPRAPAPAGKPAAGKGGNPWD